MHVFVSIVKSDVYFLTLTLNLPWIQGCAYLRRDLQANEGMNE